MGVDKFLTYAGLKRPITGAPSQDQVNSAVDAYLTRNPVEPGATEAEAAQIEANRTAIENLDTELAGKQPVGNYVKTVNGATPDANGNVVVATGGGGSSGSGENVDQSGMSEELKTALVNYYTHVMPNFDDADGPSYINAILTALGAAPRDEGDMPDVPVEPVDPRVALADVAEPFENILVRSSDFATRTSGWSVVVPYTEGMTVSGCFYNLWDNNYSAGIVTAPDGTNAHTEAFDAKGALIATKLEGVFNDDLYQFVATLTGYPAGSTVRINMVMGNGVTTEQQARAFAEEHREFIYYIPGEV